MPCEEVSEIAPIAPNGPDATYRIREGESFGVHKQEI